MSDDAVLDAARALIARGQRIAELEAELADLRQLLEAKESSRLAAWEAVDRVKAELQREKAYSEATERSYRTQIESERRRSVEIREDCPNPECDEGQIWPYGEDSRPGDSYDCPVCGGSGKRLKDGVERICACHEGQAPDDCEWRYVIPTEMAEGTE